MFVAVSDGGSESAAADTVVFAGPMRATEELSDYDKARDLAVTLPYMPPERINDLAAVTFAAIRGSSGRSIMPDISGSTLTGKTGSLIQELKAKLLAGSASDADTYPFEKERQLITAIETGAEDEANRILNELLGAIFFNSSYNLDTLKVKAMELTVLISRAVAGSHMKKAGTLEFDYGYFEDHAFPSLENVRKFFALSSFDEVCASLAEMLRSTLKSAYMTDKESIAASPPKHAEILGAAIGYMKRNYMRRLTLGEVAERVYVSPSYLSRLFSEELGTPFSDYLSKIRVDRSRVLLCDRNFSLAEIAELVGFSDQSYYCKVFKKITGKTPKVYRDKG